MSEKREEDLSAFEGIEILAGEDGQSPVSPGARDRFLSMYERKLKKQGIDLKAFREEHFGTQTSIAAQRFGAEVLSVLGERSFSRNPFLMDFFAFRRKDRQTGKVLPTQLETFISEKYSRGWALKKQEYDNIVSLYLYFGFKLEMVPATLVLNPGPEDPYATIDFFLIETGEAQIPREQLPKNLLQQGPQLIDPDRLESRKVFEAGMRLDLRQGGDMNLEILGNILASVELQNGKVILDREMEELQTAMRDNNFAPTLLDHFFVSSDGGQTFVAQNIPDLLEE